MATPIIRPAITSDHPAIVELYNHYIAHTPITFDIEPYTLEKRGPWFAQFSDEGRHRLLVMTIDDALVGYAGSMPYRPKAAYITTVETSIYLQPDMHGRGYGAQLYEALFDAIKGEDIHRAHAGITLPNPQSIKLHERSGFAKYGVQNEVGRKFAKYWDVVWMEKKL
ncbi:MAG: N-acetyltransferase family protein [Phycisphaeraceae bacterium]